MEAQTFAKDFFSMAITSKNDGQKNYSDHNEWLLREYAKLLNKEAEIKKREEILDKQSIVNQNSK